jgi:hypothetical protein
MLSTLGNNPVPATPSAEGSTVDLRGFSYDDRRRILTAVLEAMTACGGWVLEQKALSPTQTALRFEIQMRSSVELYSELIAAGVELTRESHMKMTELCTLRGHNPHKARKRRILTVRLELSFLEEDTLEYGAMAIGLA